MRAVGLDFGGTKYASAIMDPTTGRLLEPVGINHMPASYGEVWASVSREVGAYEQHYGPLDFIGVGLPGTLNEARTVVTKAPNAKALVEQPLFTNLRARFHCPVYFGGDVQANSAAEALYAPGAKDSDGEIIVASIGTGFGVGLVLRDDAGRRCSRATQFGHLTVEPNGEPCGCGALGCAEAYVTSWGMKRLFGLDRLEQIALLDTDQKALIGSYVGRVLQAALIGVPDARRVVFGGTVVARQRWIISAAQEWLKGNLSIVPVPVMGMSEFGASAGAVGCVAMAEMARRQGVLVVS